jgi:hypothetical protein
MFVEGIIENFFLIVSMFSGSLQCHIEHCQRQMMQDNMNPWVDPHGPSPGSALAKDVGGLTYWREKIDVLRSQHLLHCASNRVRCTKLASK